MSETPTPPKPGLSPAAWSALAAIAVAVIGGAVTLTTNWWSHQPPKAADQPARQPESAAVATPSDIPSDLSAWAGMYTGEAKAPDGQPFPVEVKILEGCTKGAVCGSIRVPNVPCTGRLTLVQVRQDGAEFSVDHFDKTSDPKACQPGAGEVLRRRADGDLDYVATYSGAHGILFAVD